MKFANRVEHSHCPGAFSFLSEARFARCLRRGGVHKCHLSMENGQNHVFVDMELQVTMLRYEKHKTVKSAIPMVFRLSMRLLALSEAWFARCCQRDHLNILFFPYSSIFR